MPPLTVALLSTAAPNSCGSMGIYGDLVRTALQEHAPDFELIPVDLRRQPVADTQCRSNRLGQVRDILYARRRAVQVKADVYHLLDGSFGFMVAGIPASRTLVTVHDLIPALQIRGRFPVPRPGWAARRLIGASLSLIGRSGAVYAVSAATAADVQTLTGRTVEAVIHNPLRALPTPPDQARDVPPMVLHVGNNGFYKNRIGVVRIFASLARSRSALRLILAGPEPDEALCREITALGLTGQVTFEVEPGDARLALLYRRASLLLFPSLYEGFGWPPLEAMHYGCPVVCSDAGSLPEVTGDAALRGAADDIAGLAAMAASVLEDSTLAADLVERGLRNLDRFGAKQLAESLVGLYEGLAETELERGWSQEPT